MNIVYKPVLPEKPLPIIIIGAGGIVRDAHLPAYKKAGFEVFGILDKEREKAEKLAAEYQIPHVFDTVEEAVAAAPENAVYDLALMPAHFVEILKQLPDGAPVLIQKPLGDYQEQTKEIYAVCKSKGLIAAVNFQLRFAPFVSAARYLIESGMIGELYDMEIRLTTYTPWEIFPKVKVHDRLEIMFHSIHYIDLVRSFLGNPRTVMAKTLRNPYKNLSSSRTTIIFNYDDIMHAVINTNHDHNFGPQNQESFIKWEGTKGAIKTKMGLLLDYPKGIPDQFEYCLLKEGEVPIWQSVPLEGSWFPEAFIGTMSSLMRYAQGATDVLPTSIDDVIKTMAVVEGAYESSEKGGVVIKDKIANYKDLLCI